MTRPAWEAACSVCTASVSVVCMGSMSLAMAAAGAAAGAGAASMAGMGSTQATARPSAGPQVPPLLPAALERLGLGFLTKVPNEVVQPLLIILILVSVGTAYLGYCAHHRPQSLVLTTISGLVMYLSIYVWMSDLLYVLSVIGLLAAVFWGLNLARPPASPGSAVITTRSGLGEGAIHPERGGVRVERL